MKIPAESDAPMNTHTKPALAGDQAKVDRVAPEMSLVETLRVLEVARGMRQDRAEAEVALARNEVRELMRKRLLEASRITGDSITETDVDAALEQYFQTQHIYADPPMSLSVAFAHVYVRRLSLMILMCLLIGLYAALRWF